MSVLRVLSVALRRRSERKLRRQVMQQRRHWEQDIQSLPAARPVADRVAIVRLDDIGDYLLWRNCLPAYRAHYAGKSLYLIGNKVWKPLFEAWDVAFADHFITVDKSLYLSDVTYRMQLWSELRAIGISEVICPSRTRPLLIDDCVVLASGAGTRIAVENNFSDLHWNRLSDAVYTRLIAAIASGHEFYFNRYCAEQMTGHSLADVALQLPIAVPKDASKVVCFIGASAKSKRWPVTHWAALVSLLKGAGYLPVLAGGPGEVEIAAAIERDATCENRVGKDTLLQTLGMIAGAGALVTGDTMAAHAGVGSGVPTVVLANGVNASRFVAYREAGFHRVATLYTDAYNRGGKKEDFIAVTQDMESIRPQQVMNALSELLHHLIAHGEHTA